MGETSPVTEAVSSEDSERQKREEIRQFLQGYESLDGSVFRLSKDPRFYTDPDGIDPITLYPARNRMLGPFREQQCDMRTLEQLAHGWAPPTHRAPMETRLEYRSGSIYVNRVSNGVECVLINDSGDFADIRWRIWNEQSPARELFLGVDIDTSYRDDNFLYGMPEREGERRSRTKRRSAFYADPALYLGSIYEGNRDSQKIEEREMEFATFWKEAFAIEKSSYPWHNFYPGQHFEAVGAGVGILERAIEAAREHRYAGLVAAPAYFHGGENFEKQGFRFENPEDAERMAMLRTALRAIDEKRYQSALDNASARGLGREEALKASDAALLTPQERSWIALLNALHNQALIPPEFNLRRVLLEKLGEDRNRVAEETELERDFELAEQGLLTPFEYQNRIYAAAKQAEAQGRKFKPSSFLADFGEHDEATRAYRQRKLAALLAEDQKIQAWTALLSGMSLLDFAPRTDEHKKTRAWDGNRMSLRFEDERTEPEIIQERMDDLIEDEIITGNTLNPPGSYVERLLAGTSSPEAPLTIVYHMYDRNGRVEQPDRTYAERKNIEHLNSTKEEIEAMGFPVRLEKAYGNVRNPGPNRPFGWPSEEPSVWRDEFRGIERSSQNALVIPCRTAEEAERVVEYLHKVGHKEEENDTRTNPAWYTPDIRVLGFDHAALDELPETSPIRQHYRPAILHAQRGASDGYATTITHGTHRMISGYRHLPVLVHEAMDRFIRKNEEKLGEYQFVSR